MHHRTGRVLAGRLPSRLRPPLRGRRHVPRGECRDSTVRKTSTRMAPAYGGYPLHVSTLTNKVARRRCSCRSRRQHGVLVGDAVREPAAADPRGGDVRTIVSGPQPGEISGVDVNSHGDIAYTSSNYTTGMTGLTILRQGKAVTADLSAFEKKHNPDQERHYGTTTTNTCVIAFLKGGRPVSADRTTRGIVDSHPYSVAAVRGGWVVGERPGTTCCSSTAGAHIKVLAVLPPQPHK